MSKNPFTRRLPQDVVEKIAKGELLAELENGAILQNPKAYLEIDKGGRAVKSLMGVFNGRRYSWPLCGCGIKFKIRAIEPK